jgi:predicted RNase H-like nuclease (RuvC/YqgF family)
MKSDWRLLPAAGSGNSGKQESFDVQLKELEEQNETLAEICDELKKEITYLRTRLARTPL